MSMIGGLHQLVGARTPASPPAVARIVIGVAAVGKALYLGAVILPRMGVEMIRLPIVEWLPPASAELVATVLAVWIIAAACFAIGWRTRIAGSVLVAAMVGIQLLDQQFYSSHLYLHTLLVLLLTVADSGATLSFDARRHGPRETISAWPVVLCCAQMSVVYGYAAVAKLTPEFLSGGIIYEAWSVHGLLPLPEVFRRWEFMAPLAVLAFLSELFLAFAFWLDWLRRLAIVVGIGLHGVIILTMGSPVELSIFAALMFSIYGFFSGLPDVSPGTPPRARIAGR